MFLFEGNIFEELKRLSYCLGRVVFDKKEVGGLMKTSREAFVLKTRWRVLKLDKMAVA